ncbi:hypothetical protein Tco_1114147 [Tanacetum coccineum]|uniref:Uncharacterized protein n=1 Tax=Tanacetum coccineum TaxID=301880 RepID=A0ABQ5IXZ2_9ASTR
MIRIEEEGTEGLGLSRNSTPLCLLGGRGGLGSALTRGLKDETELAPRLSVEEGESPVFYLPVSTEGTADWLQGTLARRALSVAPYNINERIKFGNPSRDTHSKLEPTIRLSKKHFVKKKEEARMLKILNHMGCVSTQRAARSLKKALRKRKSVLIVDSGQHYGNAKKLRHPSLVASPFFSRLGWCSVSLVSPMRASELQDRTEMRSMEKWMSKYKDRGKDFDEDLD